MYLVFNRSEWEQYRLAKLGFDFTDEELDTGLNNEIGFIGIRNGVDCYISKPIRVSSTPPNYKRAINKRNETQNI